MLTACLLPTLRAAPSLRKLTLTRWERMQGTETAMTHAAIGSASTMPGNNSWRAVWWVVLGAVLIPLVYLPTLAARFDFIDDGNLVYPSGPQPFGERAHL